MSIETMIEHIRNRRLQRLQSDDNDGRRQSCPRASQLGDCLREIYYQITEWEKKPLPNVELLARFEKGRQEEKEVVKELLDDGLIDQMHMPFEIRGKNETVILSGHVDGVVKWNGSVAVLEVKSMHPNLWQMVSSVSDFERWNWHRRYPRQVQMYMHGMGLPFALMILTDCLGHRKELVVEYDQEEAERLLNACQYVMDCVAQQIPPPFHKDPSVCRPCWARNVVCFPDMQFEGIETIEDPEAEARLLRILETENLAAEHEALVKWRKEYFKGRQCQIGDFYISGKWIERKAYSVAAGRYWKMEVEHVGDGK